jgi:hypothetical protein
MPRLAQTKERHILVADDIDKAKAKTKTKTNTQTVNRKHILVLDGLA